MSDEATSTVAQAARRILKGQFPDIDAAGVERLCRLPTALAAALAWALPPSAPPLLPVPWLRSVGRQETRLCLAKLSPTQHTA